MKAIIVAAGLSRRLRSISKDRPKCLLDFGGKSLIERSMDYLKNRGIKEIYVVVGYEYKQMIETLGNSATYVHNPWFATTNNMTSLWFALPYVLEDDFMYLHADLLYHPKLLDVCLGDRVGDILMLTEKKRCVLEDMKVRVDGDRFLYSSKDIPIDQAFGEWSGITRFKEGMGKFMYDEISTLLYQSKFDAYDTAAFSNLVERGIDIRVVLTNDLPWIEIDFPKDYEIAKNEILRAIDANSS